MRSCSFVEVCLYVHRSRSLPRHSAILICMQPRMKTYHPCYRNYPPKFGLKLLRMFPELLTDRHHPAKLSPQTRQQDALQMFRELDLGDMWQDAAMGEVLVYLRGNKHLLMPAAWKEVLDVF